MGVNRVDFGGQTLIDLSADTVVAEKLLEGTTAHAANGEPIVGTMSASSGGSIIESPLVVPISVTGGGSTTESFSFSIPLAVNNLTKLIIRTLTMGGKNGVSGAQSQCLSFYIYGTKEDGTPRSVIKCIMHFYSSTTDTYSKTNDLEIDLSGFKSVDTIIVLKSGSTKTVYPTYFSVTGSVELYF